MKRYRTGILLLAVLLAVLVVGTIRGEVSPTIPKVDDLATLATNVMFQIVVPIAVFIMIVRYAVGFRREVTIKRTRRE